MASDCENQSATGKPICEVLESTGVGTGELVDAIKSPLVVFLLFIGVATGAVGIFKGINKRVTRGVNGRS